MADDKRSPPGLGGDAEPPLEERIADRLQERGRKASTGEPLFFDRLNLVTVIRDVLAGQDDGPANSTPDRLMLNAYGRRCYRAGEESATAALTAARAPQAEGDTIRTALVQLVLCCHRGDIRYPEFREALARAETVLARATEPPPDRPAPTAPQLEALELAIGELLAAEKRCHDRGLPKAEAGYAKAAFDLQDFRMALRAPSAAPPQAWRDISTAPKDKTLVILALVVDGVVWRVHEGAFNGLAWYTKNGGSLPQMTHWMPLPDPPVAAPPPQEEP